MKFVKIKFTSWRDAPPAGRSAAFEKQLDAWATRLSEFSAAAAQIKKEQAEADSEALQSALARVTADLEKIDAERTLLLSQERAAAEAETRAAKEHERTGTLGYRVLSDAGNHVTRIVDEFGNDLPETAVYTFEVVDPDPPRPDWAKQERPRTERRGVLAPPEMERRGTFTPPDTFGNQSPQQPGS
ncbi:MAG TPA: hypothetical protein VN664_06905 [Burkholderiales bacterium]|jgi:hypothetical protein|nr:hypothetical protein [Burkholderiales bacterium]